MSAINKLLIVVLLTLFTRCFAAGPRSAATGVPLCSGLTIVTAISQPEGDYESIKSIGSIDGSVIRLRYSNEMSDPGKSSIKKLLLDRNIRLADMRTAKLYLQQYSTNVPSDVPGTTAVGVSSAVLSALKTRGEAELGMFDLPPGLPGSAKMSASDVLEHYEIYKLRRVENGPVMVSVILNDVMTELPAIHATGKSDFYGYRAEFFFLDDESNPLALKWRLRIGSVLSGPKAGGDRATLQVVKIAHHCDGEQVSRLERALLENGRVDVYDIFFSFNSDQIREESEPTMREIYELLRHHPDWKLNIDGHTDGIASDTFNLDLSQRRAAAVKNALATGFGINADRLTTAGHGKSRPIDTNDTPEGRARNRRVELVKLP